MKVLFLATRDWRNPGAAGGDIQMWEYARYLAARAHTVTFLASSFVGAPREELVDSVHVVRLGGVLSLWLRTFLHYMLHCRGKYDIIVADDDGAVVIPAALADFVASEGAEHELMESWLVQEVEKGAKLPGLYPPNDENKKRYEEWKKKR